MGMEQAGGETRSGVRAREEEEEAEEEEEQDEEEIRE